MRILVNDYVGHPFQLQLSRALARGGHTVHHTYFGAHQTPKGRTDSGDELAGKLAIECISIKGEFKQHSVISRRGADKAYGKAVCQRLISFRPNIVISSNTPLDAQRQILEAAHAVDARFVFWLQDVLSMAMEFVLRRKHVPFSRLVGRLYSRLEQRLLRESDAIVCIAPEFREQLEVWKIPRDKTFVIENWAPLDEIQAMPRDTPWAASRNLTGKMRFIYSGTLGMKHRPQLLLDLARRYGSRGDVVVVAVAQGAGADWLLQNASTVPAEALQILPFQPYERHSEVLASADVLVALLDDDCGAFAVPSKALSYMCAGRALLVAAPAENLVSKLIARSGAGVATAPNTGSFLAGAERLAQDPDYRAMCGVKAREHARRTFDIESIRNQFMEVFAYAMKDHRTRAVGPVPTSPLAEPLSPDAGRSL